MLRHQKILILATFVLLSLLTRGLFLGIEVLDIDESAHVIGSWILMDGKLLYTDFVDNKPPLLYAYYALAEWVFGRSLFGVHLFTALFTIPVTAFAASSFFQHSHRGIVAGVLFLVFSAAFYAHDMHATNAEILMILPGTWALILVRDEQRAMNVLRIAAAGFLLGTGVLLKYQIAVWLAPIAIAIGLVLWKQKKHENGGALMSRWILLMFVLGLGFSLPLLLTYGWFYLRNGADELIFWTILNNIEYSANPISLREAIGRASSYLLPFLIATLPLWWCAWRSRNLFESEYRRLFSLLLIVFSIPPVMIGFRFYPHYFIQLYIPLCLASAPYISGLVDFPLSFKGKLFVSYVLVLFFGFTITNSILYFFKTDVYRETDPVFQKITAELKQDSCSKNASLFVWGNVPILYYQTRFTPATRFVAMSQSGLTPYISGNQNRNIGKVIVRHWNWLMQDLKKNKATYIIDTAPAGLYRWDRYPVHDYSRLQKLLQKNYDRFSEVDGFVLYRHKDCIVR